MTIGHALDDHLVRLQQDGSTYAFQLLPAVTIGEHPGSVFLDVLVH